MFGALKYISCTRPGLINIRGVYGFLLPATIQGLSFFQFLSVPVHPRNEDKKIKKNTNKNDNHT